MSNKYDFNSDTVVHETEHYAVDVGEYPEEALPCYRVHNKRTGVVEYAHCIQFYATQWADMATQLLNGEAAVSPMLEANIDDLPQPLN